MNDTPVTKDFILMLRNAIYRGFAGVLRLVLRIPFPGRWRLFATAINHPRWARFWQGAPLRWTRCKNSGLSIPCDLSVFSGRIAWYFRRWYEIDTQSAIRTLLPRGGTFIDLGANVGMASLSAASAIGREGRIVAFEPNPRVARIYREAMARNGLGELCTLHNAAVADREGEMDLFIPSTNHGEASLATGFDGREGQRVSVRVTDGQELGELDRIDLIKIDVEGFELVVLKAIAPLLLKFGPPLIMERMDEHLHRAGSSSIAIDEFMQEIGYRGFDLGIAGAGLFRQRASLTPLSRSSEPADGNVLWLTGKDAERLSSAEFMALRK